MKCPVCDGSGEVLAKTVSNDPRFALPEPLCNSCRRRRGIGLPDSCEFDKLLHDIRLKGVSVVVTRCEYYWKEGG